MSPLNCGAVVRISLPADIANGNMIENAPQRIAPDNRNRREPEGHFRRLPEPYPDPEKREDHRLGAHGNDIPDGHIDAGFDKAVKARLSVQALHISASTSIL